MTIGEQITVRHYQPSDLPALVDLSNSVRTAIGDPERVNVEAIRLFMESPNFDAANDTFVVEHAGRIIGYADVEFSDKTGRAWSDGMVQPDCWGQGIGTELIRLVEQRALEWADEKLAPGRSLSLQRFTDGKNQAAQRLLEANGYRHLRTYYQMRIAFDQPVEAPPLPAGLALRPFDPARDAQAVYEAQQEAFEDHWGHERSTYEEWTHFALNHPGSDHSLWLIAYDQEADAIAGICISRPYGKTDPSLAWVSSLGVRRPWRKRGLGTALLKNSFARFQQHGYSGAGLGVDAASLTNAVALYQRAGMHIHNQTLDYEKRLRGEIDRS